MQAGERERESEETLWQLCDSTGICTPTLYEKVLYLNYSEHISQQHSQSQHSAGCRCVCGRVGGCVGVGVCAHAPGVNLSIAERL